MRSEIRGF